MPSFSERWVISLARWRTSQAWPGTSTILVVLIAIVLACAAVTGLPRTMPRAISATRYLM